MREKQSEVERLVTAKMEITLEPNQSFWRTPNAWEIWEESPTLRRIHRIPCKRVFWVVTK